ncbi:hypothetical protein D3C72_1377090 [compost metagenome]
MHLAGVAFSAIGGMRGDVRIGVAETFEIHVEVLQVDPDIRGMGEGPGADRVEVDAALQRPGVLFLLLLSKAAHHVLRDRRKLVGDKGSGVG